MVEKVSSAQGVSSHSPLRLLSDPPEAGTRLSAGASRRGDKGPGKRKNKLSLVLICLLLLSFLLVSFYSSLSDAESLSDIKIDALQAPPKDMWGRDPFVRYEDRISGDSFLKEDLPMDLKVDGIIMDGKKALAIINGGFYRKRERVNDFLIVDIGRDKISLEKNGKTFYLGIEKFAIESAQKGVKK